MAITESAAKTILRKQKRVDSWFMSRYGMNLYRGCTHNCAYCDGRSERYHVAGEYGRDVVVKTNAAGILDRELDPARKRKPLVPGFIVLGGGVCDSYQPAEEHYRITRSVLQVIERRGYPLHVLTKSTLVERDLDIIERISEHSCAVVSMSFSCTDDMTAAVFEPGVPSPTDRLACLARIRRRGIRCGMFLLPVIPFVTDTPEHMDRSVEAARAAGLDFVLFGGMTLKPGRQREHFMAVLEAHFPEAALHYDMVYGYDTWGRASSEYYDAITRGFDVVARAHRMVQRVPLRLVRGLVPENDLVVLALDHIDYYLKAAGNRSPYGYAAHMISQLTEPIRDMGPRLRQVKGVGRAVEKVVAELIDTGTAPLLEELTRYAEGGDAPISPPE
jgi:DNA repair photolyase